MSTKHLINQPRAGRWLILLFALLTTPLGLRAQESYGLTVAGVEVTSENASDILSEDQSNAGKVSFDAQTNTLTLNGAYISGYTSTNGCITTNRSALNIAISGNNTLDCSADSCTTIRSTRQGGTALTFVKGGDNSSLILKGGRTIRDFATVNVEEGLYLNSNSPNFHLSYGKFVDYNYQEIVSLTISTDTSYPVWVCNDNFQNGTGYTQVTESNHSDILGNNSVAFSYNGSTFTLTLNNYNVEGMSFGNYAFYIGDGLTDLVVSLEGENNIRNSGSGFDFANEGANLTFVTSETNPGSLYVVNDVTDSWDNVVVNYENGLAFDLYTNTITKNWARLRIQDTPITGTTSSVEGYEGVSFDAATNTLTLNGATIGSQNTTISDILVFVKDLTVEIGGTNKVYGRFYGEYQEDHSVAGNITFTKKADAETASLTITGWADGGGPVTQFVSCTCGPGLFVSALTVDGAPVSNLLFSGYEFVDRDNNDNSVGTVVFDTTEPATKLTIGDVEVTETTDFTGTSFEGKASYDADTKTLTLNNLIATTNVINIISNIDALTIYVTGENNIGNISASGVTYQTLAFAGDGNLTLTWDDGVITDFNAVNTGDFNLLSNTTPGVHWNDERKTYRTYDDDAVCGELTLTKAAVYPLWLGNTQVTAANKSNVLNDAENIQVSFENGILTLNSAKSMASSNIVTGISLTINLKGRSDVNQIISTNPDATLTFGLAEGADNESSLWTSKNGPSWWQGFSGNPTFNDKLVYLPNADVDYIQKLLPPTLFVEDGLLSFSGLSDSYGSNHFDCYYNIDNVQGDDVAEKKYNPESTSPDAINKPCVVTAHAEFTDVYGNTVKSDNAVGKLFGFERSTVDVPAGSSVDIPAVVPAIAEADGLTISYSPDTSENDPMAYASNGKINAGNQMGTTSIQGRLNVGTTEPAYKVLNEANDYVLGEITVNVVPVAPTVDPEEDGTYSTNTKVTMFSDYVYNDPQTAAIKYYLNDAQSEQLTYQDEPLSFEGDVTIHAWVEVQDPTNATVHKSEEVVRTYTFKPEPTLAFSLYDNNLDDNCVFSNTYGEQFDEPELKVTGGEFQVTYSSSNTNVATVDSSTGEVTIKSAGKTTITATVEETDEHFGAARSYQLRVTPKIEMTENCILFPGQTISVQVSPEGATIKYGVNEEAKTDYTGAITVNENMLSQHDIHVYVNATYGEGDDQVESDTSTRYFVYDRPTVSVPAGTYNDAQHVQITNLPQRDYGDPKVYYYFGNDENNATLYENDAIIDIVESKMLKYYIFEEETLVYKSTPVEAEYVIRTVPEMSYVDGNNKPVEVAEWTIGAENQQLPTLKNELQLQVTYSSTKTDVATVDNNGSVTPVGVGETRITATSTQTDIYKSTETSYLLHVYKMLNHESITIEAIDDQPYTGAPIEPTVTVKDGQTDITNYVNIAYSNNVAVGTSALVTITPKETEVVNYYKGSATTSFNIVNRTLEEGKDVTFASGQSWASYFTNSETLEVPEGIVAYVLTGVNGGTLTVQAISKVKQDVPVLLEKTNNAVTTNDTYDENLLRGTAEATSVTGIEGVVYVLYNGEFVRTKSGTIPAHRAYLVLSSDAGARLSIGFDDEATGIRNLEADGNGNDVWFSLDGQRFDKKPAKKGLYIHNGEKEFVK